MKILPVFAAALLASVLTTHAAPTHLVDEAPVRISQPEPGVYLVDFGRVAFGNLRLTPPANAQGNLNVHFGEAQQNGRIWRNPPTPSHVRYYEVQRALEGNKTLVVAPPPDVRNTWEPGKTDYREVAKKPGAPAEPPPPAILTPAEWGVVTPFRWVEIYGWPGELHASHLMRQSIFASTWRDDAAAFVSSDDTLNRIWEMCRYSIKATTFAGVYVDGDRERIPYEGDAYLNQLSHYATDYDVQMARDTFDHLMKHGTWPTEWASHMIFMAHADWWQTGDKAWLAARFDSLKQKLLLDRLGPDGLITSSPEKIKKGDLVDWPVGERDGFVFTGVNSVANAFYLRALEQMIDLARVLDRKAEVAEYSALLAKGRAAFQSAFYISENGLYRDGVGTDHSAMHSTLFALAFGHVPNEHRARASAWLATRKMDVSVYVAQYFMEALFLEGHAARAVDLMLAPGDRSWRHMLASGTTVSWEAWDQKYKPNQDWNHAWGAAPANLLPRFILGVHAATPGWATATIAPQTGGLTSARGKVPTPRGAISVQWQDGATFRLDVELPKGVTAQVKVPASAHSTTVQVNGKKAAATRAGSTWLLTEPVSGTASIAVF